MEIEYTIRIRREGKQFMAHAMPLEVSGSSATPEAAGLALNGAVGLFIATADEH
jgi:hypothetical protein